MIIPKDYPCCICEHYKECGQLQEGEEKICERECDINNKRNELLGGEE